MVILDRLGFWHTNISFRQAVLTGIAVPMVRLWPQECPPTLKVELALDHYGLQF